MTAKAVEVDVAAGWADGLARAAALGADGLIIPIEVVPATDVLAVDALTVDLDRPVVAVTASLAGGSSTEPRAEELVRLVRLAQQLGGGGVQLRLSVGGAGAAWRQAVLTDVVAPLQPLAEALGVSVVLDDAPLPGWEMIGPAGTS